MMNVAEYPSISDDELPRWESWIERTTGIVLSGRKQLLEQGIYPRLLACGLSSLEEYRKLIDIGEGGGLEKAALIDQLTVKDSRFFRNEQSMNAVGEYLDRVACDAASEDCELRVWSVGCALGQEPYSLAMTLAERFDDTNHRWQVLGTDISPSAIIHAGRGIYSEKQLGDVSPARLARFFEPAQGGRRVCEALRRRVRFGTSNLRHLEECPYHGLDVIFCQNVLIYFRRDTVRHILEHFIDRLNPGGLLVLGAGEAPEWNSRRAVRWMPGRLNAYRVC